MKFKELKINDDFTLAGSPVVYTRVPDVKKTCCKLAYNAMQLGTSTRKLIKPLEEVTKVEK